MKRLSLLFTVFVLLFSSCSAGNPADSANDTNIDSTETAFPQSASDSKKINAYINALCSKEFTGRMAGTEGNELAGKWLSDKLAEFDVIPLYENYEHFFLRALFLLIVRL